MKLGNIKEIDGEDYFEILDHNYHVKGYIKDQETYNNLILESEALIECEKELLRAGDREGELYYRLTHPEKKFKEKKQDGEAKL